MDFTFTEAQEAVSEAASSVFSGRAAPERVAGVEATEDRFDRRLWAELASTNLLGLAVEERFGGSGLGLVATCLLLQAQGRQVAPIPLLATVVLGAMPLARFGSEPAKERWLPAVASGDAVLSAAITEVGSFPERAVPLRAREDRGCWRITGTARAVPQAHLADRVVAFGRSDEGEDLAFLVDPRGESVELEREVCTDRQVHPNMHIDGARVTSEDLLGAPDGLGARGTAREVLDWLLLRARTGLAAMALGVCEEALVRTAAYLNERQQFGRAISSFQAPLMRAADASLDVEAMRLTLWSAAWRIDTGRDAAAAVAAAHWWASEAGQRVVHATQHLHGGIGADVSYPIHRYFLWAKQIELMLGSPAGQLAALGDLLSGAPGR